jgi:hypothetical protein
MGFRFECDPYTSADKLPIVRNMFHGTTVVQCNMDEQDILKLMSQPEINKQKMLEFLQDIDTNCVPAKLECIPENASALTSSGTIHATGMKSVDSQHWSPEIPERIGIYHAYVRGYNRDVRTHRLFIACSGGLNRACDAFCNLVIDVGKHWTMHDVMVSEEAWWLKKACQRSRCKLIKQLADKFNIDVTHIEDIQAYNPSYMAIPTSDTLEHDISLLSNGRIAVYNMCIDTTKNMNGMVCNMHPSEGVWLFRGASRGACFGSMYGDHSTCGVFPVKFPLIHKKHQNSITVQDSNCIVRLHSKPSKENYMCCDENYFKNLEKMQWNRDNGYAELIPIVVGLK